ncbi:MAG: hypothetical protein ACOVO9_06325, partial [Bacteroidia bacterium]
MFDNMKPIKLILFYLLILSNPLLAQEKHCATVMSEAQLATLKKFQTGLDNNQTFFKKAGIQYVPIQINITGTDQGSGYYKIESALQALCDINKDFAPTGFRF